MKAGKVRLFVDAGLAAGQEIALTSQAHYLVNVMRLGPGDPVVLFNGRDGAWQATIAAASKRAATLVCDAQVAAQQAPPDLWLLFAPIKKARTDFIVEKATELGAARICPVQTAFTNSERVRTDRLRAHAVEAAEQCGGTYVPEIAELTPLIGMLDSWPEDRRLLHCDEARVGAHDALASAGKGPWAILIGPEGGFSAAERTHLQSLPFVTQIGLGPRILRADTAAVAALTLWQAALGDWS